MSLRPERLAGHSMFVLATVASSLLVGGTGKAAWGQASGRAPLDTLTVMVGGGVRGRIDTLKVQVKGGPSDQEFFRIVRAKGHRASYAFVADSGFQNLSVMVGTRLLSSQGEVVVGDAQLMIISADRAVQLRPENRKLFRLLRAQLTAKDHVLAHQRVGCEMDRLMRLYGPSRSDSLIREAEFLAIDPIRDQAALRRVDNALAGHVFSAGCDTTRSGR